VDDTRQTLEGFCLTGLSIEVITSLLLFWSIPRYLVKGPMTAFKPEILAPYIPHNAYNTQKDEKLRNKNERLLSINEF